MGATSELRFIVDCNVGKLARWLRMMGYDATLFTGDDDSQMIIAALRQERVILTRDTRIMKMGVVTGNWVRAVFIESEEPEHQIRQVIDNLHLDCRFKPFTICLECNQALTEVTREEVKDRVPPYVFQTQDQYMECPQCHRMYWQGTHWQAMTRELERFCKG
ncbi:Mut7-C RNAse domain-containing protein [Chloroflexota bacterium]